MKKLTSQIFIAIVCAILGFLLANQFKVLNEKNKINSSTNNLDIISEIESLKKEKEELVKRNEELTAEVKKLEEVATMKVLLKEK